MRLLALTSITLFSEDPLVRSMMDLMRLLFSYLVVISSKTTEIFFIPTISEHPLVRFKIYLMMILFFFKFRFQDVFERKVIYKIHLFLLLIKYLISLPPFPRPLDHGSCVTCQGFFTEYLNKLSREETARCYHCAADWDTALYTLEDCFS